jgi:hypothetical protein
MSERRTRVNEKEPLEKTVVSLYKSDLSILRAAYRRLGYNRVIRLLVRAHVQTLVANMPSIKEEEKEIE